jgi:hypothetical protein
MNYDKGSNVSQNVWELEEFFVPIQGFEERYKISNKGVIISFNRKSLQNNPDKMNPYIDTVGYRSVSLHENGKPKYMRLHRLLCIHFLPNPNNYPFVNHKDGNKLNSCLSNLEWCTAKQNLNHATEMGLINNRGEGSFHAKLKNEDVIELRRLRSEDKWTQLEIAKKYNISRRHVSDIVNRVCWHHI